MTGHRDDLRGPPSGGRGRWLMPGRIRRLVGKPQRFPREPAAVMDPGQVGGLPGHKPIHVDGQLVIAGITSEHFRLAIETPRELLSPMIVGEPAALATEPSGDNQQLAADGLAVVTLIQHLPGTAEMT